jgi:hypothetical protein
VDEEPLEDALLMRDEQVMHHAVAEVRGEDLARLGAGRDEADGAPRPSQVPPSSVADPPQAPPWHASFFVQRLPSSQSVPSASPAGHATCVPSQIPSSHAFSGLAGQHTVPALPGGCVQKFELPLHTSRVQGLPSSVQPVPSAAAARLTPVAGSQVSGRPKTTLPPRRAGRIAPKAAGSDTGRA